ncbi:MAG TPA: FAD-dependent oxidoreductase, partial [Devosia sp.]|nr:FAD-dependent oxidoreductase [Devosia sp.]
MLDRPDKPNSFPVDRSDLEHLESARPHDWVNPKPAPCYNLVVLGGGPAGLVAARGAVAFGAKVALIEDDMIGGDCLNVGCVPSKSLIAAAKMAQQGRHGEAFGLR